MTPEHVFADAREQVGTMRLYGQSQVADAVEQLLDRLQARLAEYPAWHDEAGAVLMSGKSAGYFRAQSGNRARRGRGQRYYRACVIPTTQRVAEIIADAQRTAREEAA